MLIRAWDKDRSGLVDYDEFVGGLRYKYQKMETGKGPRRGFAGRSDVYSPPVGKSKTERVRGLLCQHCQCLSFFVTLVTHLTLRHSC